MSDESVTGIGVFCDFDAMIDSMIDAIDTNKDANTELNYAYEHIDVPPPEFDLCEVRGAPADVDFEKNGLLMSCERCVNQSPVLKYPFKPTTLYPSAASCIGNNGRVIGKCLRQAWYTLKIGHDMPRVKNKPSYWVTQIGEFVESRVVQHLKELGAYVPLSSQHPIYIPGLGISGKIDIAFVDKGEVCIGEVKTTSSKNVPFMDGTIPWGSHPKPSDSHLMQIMLYLNEFAKQGIKRGHILYICRDTGQELEFKVKLVNCNDGMRRAIVAKIGGAYNLVEDITIESMLDRYEQLRTYVDNDIMPPRDFELFYTPEEMEHLINKSNPKWRKNTKVAKAFKERGKCAMKWQCVWCDYVEVCYADDERVNREVINDIERERRREK